jgi:hypothetical protein
MRLDRLIIQLHRYEVEQNFLDQLIMVTTIDYDNYKGVFSGMLLVNLSSIAYITSSKENVVYFRMGSLHAMYNVCEKLEL